MRDAGRLRPENPASSRTRCRIGLRSSLTPDVCGNHRKRPSDMQRSVPSARCFCCAPQNEMSPGTVVGAQGFQLRMSGCLQPAQVGRYLNVTPVAMLQTWRLTGSVTAANTIGTEVVALQCHDARVGIGGSGESVTNSVAYPEMLLASAAQR